MSQDKENQVPVEDSSQIEEKESKPSKKEEKTIAKLEAQIESLTAEKDELLEKAKEWENKYYTAYADMANTRKAVDKENEEFKKYAISKAIQEIIPVLDSFDMALKNEPADENIKNYVAGFKMIHSKLLNSLKQLGVEIIDPNVNDVFNPHLMEAFASIDGEEDNLIAEVYTKGYKLYDHLLRPAGVIITKKVEVKEGVKEEKEEETDNNEESQNTSETKDKEEK